MNVAVLTDGIYPYVVGGMQKHSTNLIKYLSLNGINITLFHCVFDEDLPSEEKVNLCLFGEKKEKYIKVHTYHFPTSIKFPGHYIYRSKKYSKYIYEDIIGHVNEYDFIYAKGFSAWELLKARENGITTPSIGVNFHGYEMWQYAPSFQSKLKQYLLRPFVRWNSKKSDYVFSYGSKITEIIKSIGVDDKNIIEIPSGIEKGWIRNTLTGTDDVVRFLFLGRYERRKGIEEINLVLEKIANQDLKVEFHFIGPIPENKKVKSLGKEIVYYGSIVDVNKVRSIMDVCDVLICPSYSEGMPNVILEGMSRGLAIIATDVGATDQLVDDTNGKLIKFENSKELMDDLYKLILIFSTIDQSELLLKQEMSLKKINDFSFNEIADKHYRFFANF